MNCISEFEWHGLPVVDFSIGEGGVELVVTPYDSPFGLYKSFSLKLFGYEEVRVKMDSEITLPTISEMEIHSFEFQQIGEKLSGKLSILTGSTGFWSIEFKNAEWSFDSSI
ncbi:hypothetical protein [Hahella ganghwensis]|uniref:hypothetical protein n=1 Tax=Hahella ganghwensis TaxID=286420 RepID=UPI00037BB05E|nr:hypothetical protein [Hahella ganghwensis]